MKQKLEGKLLQNWRETEHEMEGNEISTHCVLIGYCSVIIRHPVNTYVQQGNNQDISENC